MPEGEEIDPWETGSCGRFSVCLASPLHLAPVIFPKCKPDSSLHLFMNLQRLPCSWALLQPGAFNQ